jgi:hypothetical protein
MRGSVSLVLLAVAASLVCMGQTCSPGTPAGVPTSVPGGVYSGQVSTMVRLLLDNELQNEKTSTADHTQAFGSDGSPLNTVQSPLYVGYTEAQAIAGMTVTLTVTSIQPTANGVTVNYTAVFEVPVDDQVVDMTGTGQATFALASGGSVEYSMALTVSYTGPNGSTVSMNLQATGMLYR